MRNFPSTSHSSDFFRSDFQFRILQNHLNGEKVILKKKKKYTVQLSPQRNSAVSRKKKLIKNCETLGNSYRY